MVHQRGGYTETHTKRAAVSTASRPGELGAVWKTVILVRVFEKVKNNKNGDYALFALTDTGYEKLALNFADIRNKLAEQRQIILSYKEYYESE